MTLISIDAVSDYLKAKSTPCDTITELTGGTGNYVYRIAHSGSPSFILKHAEPYVRSAPAIQFPTARMKHEAAALKTLPTLLIHHETLQIELPSLLEHDDSSNVLQLSDGGASTLKDAYVDSVLDIDAIGRRLGAWLAHLHEVTAETDIGDNLTAKAIYRYCYRNLASSFEKFGLDPEFARYIDNEYGSRLQTDNQCMAMGDFWPGNVLLPEQKVSDPVLTVVDWELVRRGTSATDLGQFAAEAWLLDNFRGINRGLKTAFVQSYLKHAKPSQDIIKRAAIHFGCHLSFWPTRVEWGDFEQTKRVVRLGYEVMKRADDGDFEWLEKSEFLGDSPA